MQKVIAITGATGFIGGALIKRLSAGGRQIKALIRPATGHKQPVDGTTKWIQGDLNDADSLRNLVRGADAVVHCAGVVRGATREQFNHVNVKGVAQLAQAASDQQPVPRFLLISSLAARAPQLSAYAASKKLGEGALMDLSGNMEWTVFRPSAVYGPGDRELMPVFRWMAKGIAPLLGSGDRRFSLIYIADLAEAIEQWLDCPHGHRRTFELHDGKPAGYSWHEVIDTISSLRGAPVVRLKIPVGMLKLASALNVALARTFGYAPMLTPGKIRELSHTDWSVDNAAIMEATGWSPKIELAEGLQRTLGLSPN
ncbi:MAG: SDR family NAD(P)-dependent oxidoreductase [Desulfobacterales bacterium]|jgi:nucleoside-diphosphate-sugar epimerase